MPGGVLVGAVEACWAHNLLNCVVFEVFGELRVLWDCFFLLLFFLLLLGQFCSSIYIAGVVKLLEQCVCLEVSKAVLEASIDGCGILRSVF